MAGFREGLEAAREEGGRKGMDRVDIKIGIADLREIEDVNDDDEEDAEDEEDEEDERSVVGVTFCILAMEDCCLMTFIPLLALVGGTRWNDVDAWSVKRDRISLSIICCVWDRINKNESASVQQAKFILSSILTFQSWYVRWFYFSYPLYVPSI